MLERTVHLHDSGWKRIRKALPWRNSLRLRILGLVFLAVLATYLLIAAYSLHEFERMSVFQLEHEALVLSDLTATTIVPLLVSEPDTVRVQSFIDQLALAREQNDIEINVLLLEGHRSSIIASNIPDNIETASVYEHRDMLAALEKGEPIVFIGRDDDSADEPPPAPSSPDYYIRPGYRFLSVTTPVIVDGNPLGSINTKLSLAAIDGQLARIKLFTVIFGAALPLLSLLAVYWAIQRGLRPLNQLASDVSKVKASDLSARFESDNMPSEMRPIALRLNELMDRLEASFTRERRFTSNVAHELRTPIATLKVMSEVALRESASSSEADPAIEICNDVLEVANQMERLVANLLGLVRCESGTQEVHFASLELGEIIERAWSRWEQVARDRRLETRFLLNGETLVRSDGTLLEAILTNLFSNAATYATEGGRIQCALDGENQSAILRVSNTVSNVEEGDLPLLFEPFWRKDSSRSDQSHCGIGLSLVAAYAQILGVEVGVSLPEDDVFQVDLRIPLRAAGAEDC